MKFSAYLLIALWLLALSGFVLGVFFASQDEWQEVFSRMSDPAAPASIAATPKVPSAMSGVIDVASRIELSGALSSLAASLETYRDGLSASNSN